MDPRIGYLRHTLIACPHGRPQLQAIALPGPARGAQITRIWAAGVLTAWQARLERQGRTGQRPCVRGNVAAGQDESAIVQLDEVAAPLCAPLGTDHYEDGRGGDVFTPAGLDVLERQGCQAGLAAAARQLGVRSRTPMSGVAFSWVMR